MKNKNLYTVIILCLSTLISCSQNETKVEESKENLTEKTEVKPHVPHNYGGYYCPDNLGGFPAVDISNWKDVPVVNGRMATKQETQNGTSLIFVDMEKYPYAKPLDMTMPKLARYFNRSSQKNELIIVIQALNISNDSIVGFRYLNGGNGSARLNEITLLSDNDINAIKPSRFVSIRFDINASKEKIWNVLTKEEFSKELQPIFDKNNELKANWYKSSKVNFVYPRVGNITSEFAGELWGSQYIQIDCEQDDYQYVEKFFVGENQETKSSELVIACGPYGDDFERQQKILENWSQKVRELSEQE